MNSQRLSDDEARRIIKDNNASNALEGIEAHPPTDETMFKYLTGQITNAQKWEELRQQWIAEHGSITPEMNAMINRKMREDDE